MPPGNRELRPGASNGDREEANGGARPGNKILVESRLTWSPGGCCGDSVSRGIFRSPDGSPTRRPALRASSDGRYDVPRGAGLATGHIAKGPWYPVDACRALFIDLRHAPRRPGAPPPSQRRLVGATAAKMGDFRRRRSGDSPSRSINEADRALMINRKGRQRIGKIEGRGNPAPEFPWLAVESGAVLHFGWKCATSGC